MDANTLQRMNNERDRADQKTKQLEGSLGLALQAIKRLEVEMQASKTCKLRDNQRKAPIVLMDDNLTKAKKAPQSSYAQQQQLCMRWRLNILENRTQRNWLN